MVSPFLLLTAVNFVKYWNRSTSLTQTNYYCLWWEFIASSLQRRWQHEVWWHPRFAKKVKPAETLELERYLAPTSCNPWLTVEIAWNHAALDLGLLLSPKGGTGGGCRPEIAMKLLSGAPPSCLSIPLFQVKVAIELRCSWTWLPLSSRQQKTCSFFRGRFVIYGAAHWLV